MLNATLIKRVELTPELLILHVKPDVNVPDFTPGQYVALALPGSHPRPENFPPEPTASAPDKLIKRAYSIGSSPAEKGYLEFYIAIVPEGALTSRLVTLKEGDRLFMAPKITGTFTLHNSPATANLVFVATGTGIAPFMSMLRLPSTWTEGRKITLIHGVRYATDLAYADELQALKESNANFSYYPVVSRVSTGWGGMKGYVQHLFRDNVVVLNPAVDHVFLCGNPAMIDEVVTMLGEKGYTEHTKKNPGNLHLERYW